MVRSTMSRTVVLGVALALGLASQSGAQAADSLRREVVARTDSLLAAFRRNEPLAVSRIFADDATILGPQGLRVEGRAALDAYWLARPRPDSWLIETMEVGGSRDEPWQYARSIRLTTANGEQQRTVTTFILVWRRDSAGVLRIHLDLFP
jgi:ketosteroid isomerase-like protein